MATTLTSGPDSVNVYWDYRVPQAYGDSTAASTFRYVSSRLDNGTGTSQADKVYLESGLTIAASGTDTIDLSAFSDSFGKTTTLARVKGIYIENSTEGSATSITVGAAGTSPFVNWITSTSAAIRVRNGMCFYLGLCPDATGFPLTATSFNLKIANEDSSHSAKVHIRIVGTSTSASLYGRLDFSNPLNSYLLL